MAPVEEMFIDLGRRIEELTRTRRATRTPRVARSLVLIAHPELRAIREWHRRAFPTLDPDIAALSPWVVDEGDEARLADEIARAVDGALDAGRLFKLTGGGLTVADSLFQVFIVSDLSVSDGWARAKRGIELIRSAFDKRIGETGMVAFLGIFILRRPARSSPAGEQAKSKKLAPPAATAIKNMVGNATAERLNRVFLLDTANLSQTILSAEADLHVLAGQLIYYLQTGPASGDTSTRYEEWLQRAPFADELVSGCSAFSLVWPADQLLALAAVTQGAEVLRRSLLGDSEGERERHYLNSFLQSGRLVTRRDAKLALTEDPALPIPNPLAILPSMDEIGPAAYLSLIEQLSAALPRLADDYRARIEQLGARRNRARKEMLAASLDRAVMQERGGLAVARKYLEQLAQHLAQMQQQPVTLNLPEDPQSVIAEAQNLAAQMPRKEALRARALLFALALFIGTVSFPFGFLMKTLALVLLPALGLGLVSFKAHATREELENRIIEVERRVREQWQYAIDAICERVIEQQVAELQAEVKRAQEEVAAAAARVVELADWCDQAYAPEFAGESALWKYVERDRAELLSWCESAKTRACAGAEEYWGKDHPLPLWRRLSPPGRSHKPDAWELQVIEKAALYALPACAVLADVGIDDFLRRHEERRQTYRRLLERTGYPFLRLKPEAGNPAIVACFEASAGRELTVVRDLERELDESFTVESRAALSPYRITLFGFLDGVRIEQIQF